MDPDTEGSAADPVVQDPTVITLPHRIPVTSSSPEPFASPSKEKDCAVEHSSLAAAPISVGAAAAVAEPEPAGPSPSEQNRYQQPQPTDIGTETPQHRVAEDSPAPAAPPGDGEEAPDGGEAAARAASPAAATKELPDGEDLSPPAAATAAAPAPAESNESAASPTDPQDATVTFAEPAEQQNETAPAAAAKKASAKLKSKKQQQQQQQPSLNNNKKPAHHVNDPVIAALKQELSKLGCSAYAGAISTLRLPCAEPAPDPGLVDKVETPRGVRSVADLAQVTDWEAVVPVSRHRDTIRAYLHTLSKSKDAQKRDRAAKQSAVSTVMSSLNDLDYLCDEKVGLERRQAKLQNPQQPLHSGAHGRGRRNSGTNLFGSGGDDAAEQASAVKHKIERVVEELDAAKAKLQGAMGTLPHRADSAAAAREERLASRHRPWASRPASATTKSSTIRHTPRRPLPKETNDDDGDDAAGGGEEGGAAEEEEQLLPEELPRKAFIFRPEEIHPRFGSFSKAGADLAREREAKQFAAKQESLRQKAAIDELRRQVLFTPPMPPRTPTSPTPPVNPPRGDEGVEPSPEPMPAPAAAAAAASADASTPPPQPPSRPYYSAASGTAPFPYARVSVFKADFDHASRAPIIANASMNCRAPPGSPRLRREGPKPSRTSPERQPRNTGGVVGIAFGCGGAPPIPPHAAPSNSGTDGLAGSAPFLHSATAAAAAATGTPFKQPTTMPQKKGNATPVSKSRFGGEMRPNVAADPNVELLSDLVRGRDEELKRLRARAASANPFYKKWGAAARAMTYGKNLDSSKGETAAAAAEKKKKAAAAAASQQLPPQSTAVPRRPSAADINTTPARRAPSPAFWGTTSAVDETLVTDMRFVLHGHRPVGQK